MMATSCGQYADEIFISDADAIYIGVAIEANDTTSNIIVFQVIWDRNDELEPGGLRNAGYESIRNRTWRLLSDAHGHSAPGYVESGMYSAATIRETGWAESCISEAFLQNGVRYLIIEGDGVRRRSIEPLVSEHNDQWLMHVL